MDLDIAELVTSLGGAHKGLDSRGGRLVDTSYATRVVLQNSRSLRQCVEAMQDKLERSGVDYDMMLTLDRDSARFAEAMMLLSSDHRLGFQLDLDFSTYEQASTYGPIPEQHRDRRLVLVQLELRPDTDLVTRLCHLRDRLCNVVAIATLLDWSGDEHADLDVPVIAAQSHFPAPVS